MRTCAPLRRVWVWGPSQSAWVIRRVYPGKMGLFSKSGLPRNFSLLLAQMSTFGLLISFFLVL